MNDSNFTWDATAFFERLTSLNSFAREHAYRFSRVSSLEGFHDALSRMASTSAFIAVSDTSSGSLDIENTPHIRRIKTVFLAKRHAVDDMKARERCMDNMRELFRQFMSILILEKTKLEENNIFLDPRISFTEIDRYFFTGCACAFFQIALDTYTDLSYNPDEWQPE
ncbi:hypothetical protein [Duncaniella muris]|jgi:hypothetical protein|uniref:hypothetical protein n=1 Tax=Duncaniella muris TaxID=2094150 RepID=UPI002674B2B5|nr:hypothetical protein [Duncaniella muris]